MSESLVFIVPGDPEQRTGGYLFDARIVRELRRLGWTVEVVGLEGRFPDADETAERAMAQALSVLPDGRRVVIDGLALGGVPEAVLPEADRLDLTALVHHPLADERGLASGIRERLLDSERRALSACRRVIVTSPFTARRLGEIGLDGRRARVVSPGVEPADLAPAVAERLDGREPSGPEGLLCVATLTPRKGQDGLIEALAGLADRDWRLVLAGSRQRHPEFARRVHDAVEESGLADRVSFTGECDAEALLNEYRRAGVCLLPSHYEGYGMVVTEALARGLPLITTTGGALADTAPDDSCLKVAPGDVVALRRALQRWLDDPELRRRLTRRAVERREGLAGWAESGRAFAAAVMDEAA